MFIDNRSSIDKVPWVTRRQVGVGVGKFLNDRCHTPPPGPRSYLRSGRIKYNYTIESQIPNETLTPVMQTSVTPPPRLHPKKQHPSPLISHCARRSGFREMDGAEETEAVAVGCRIRISQKSTGGQGWAPNGWGLGGGGLGWVGLG